MLQVERKLYQFRTLPFSLCTAPKTFTRVTKPFILQCQKIGMTIFLYLDDALVLANSLPQAKEDGQRVVQLLHRLGFMLNLEKCQVEPTEELTHLGLVFNTQSMTFSLPQDKVLAMKALAAKVASSPTSRGVIRLLDLTNFASMALPLARLYSHCLQFSLKENYKTPANLLKLYSEATKVLHWWCTFKLQPKLICKPLTEKVVTTDASKEGYGGHMINLSFEAGGL